MPNYDEILSDAEEAKMAYVETALNEAAKDEADCSIMSGDDIFWESIGPDAWNKSVEEDIKRACYHRNAEELGTFILAAMDFYLLTYHLETIRGDWEDYV